MKWRVIKHERLLCVALSFIGSVMLGLLLVGCNPSQSIALVQTSTPTPISTATVIPTPTPTPLPSRIAGIDEPIVVKDISVKNTMGVTQRGDLKLRILNAYTEESRRSADSTPIYPDRPSSVFLTLELDYTCPAGNCLSWIRDYARLVYDGKVYVGSKTEVTLRIKEGKLEGSDSFVIYTVPRDSEFGRYVVQLPDGQTIKLSTFFK